MSSSSTAGGSALEGYREERARRRRAFAVCILLGFVVGVSAWVAAHSSGQARVACLGIAGVASLVGMASRPRPDPERWLRGSEGEIATARLLERLPDRRWEIFHDLRIPGSRANIDHVAIGPTGVWVVDTKTCRGPVEVTLFGVRLGGRRLDTAPLRWEAGVVSDRLGVPVRPIVAIHGPLRRRRGYRRGGVRIVGAQDVVSRLRRGRRRLRRSDVRALGALLGEPLRWGGR